MGSVLLRGGPGTGKTRLILKYTRYFDKILWICTTESAPAVRKKLKNNNVWIVDTHTWDQQIEVTPQDIVVKNPLNLNEVSIAVNKVLDNFKKDYFVVFDSISGLLLYHPLQKVVHFLRNLLVRVESGGGSGIFTLVKDAHDIHTETSISLLFPTIIDLERWIEDNSVKRLMKILKAPQYVESEVGEIRITENDVIIPESFDKLIKTQLNILSSL